ncbi:3-dehydroquinate synthase [Gammaproteobacteria bacterium]
MRYFSVNLGKRSYPIWIGVELAGRSDIYAPYLKKQVMIVTNETVAPLYLETVERALVNWKPQSVILPDGEEYKTLDILENIFTALLTARFDRHCTLLALGGGVIGDITGFAAASYQRGVDFIQVPTTLLAQVDSSVGGKTGVNHRLGKNMIGAFHQPKLVVADISSLTTLDDRQFSAGLAEIIKIALVRDAPFFEWLEENLSKLQLRDTEALTFAIERACRNKAEIVVEDERESGVRALLNLGHTFGHAIETGLGYGTWLHGEAVAAGIAMAADLSYRFGWVKKSEVDRISSLLDRANLPQRAPAEMTSKSFLELMAVDKKVSGGSVRFVLLQTIGQGVVTADVPSNLLQNTLETCRTCENLA